MKKLLTIVLAIVMVAMMFVMLDLYKDGESYQHVVTVNREKQPQQKIRWQN